jgi:hypothetical protein
MRVNLFAVAGAVVGIAAILTTWLAASFGIFGHFELNLIDVISEGGTDSDYFLPTILFIIGTLIAFFTPVSGILQIIGASWFMLVYFDHVDRLLSTVGPYLGMASGIVLLLSIARPIGPGLMNGPFDAKDRLLTFH